MTERLRKYQFGSQSKIPLRIHFLSASKGWPGSSLSRWKDADSDCRLTCDDKWLGHLIQRFQCLQKSRYLKFYRMIGKAKQDDTWLIVPVSKHKLPEVTVDTDQNPLLSDSDSQYL